MTGYTKIENKILERIITSDFTKGQLKILLLILRLSSGCQKPGAVLRKGDLSLAGIETDRRITELERLSLLNIVKFMRLSRGRTVIWINRNTEEWGINRVKSEKRLKKEFVNETCMWEEVKLDVDDEKQYDSYYRILAVVYVNETNLNEKMVSVGYAGVMYIPPSEFDCREWEG